MPGDKEVKGGEGGSSNEEEQSYESRDLFVILLKVSPIYLFPACQLLFLAIAVSHVEYISRVLQNEGIASH
jgi:hypothetical protein